ncbi:MAG: alpha/beta fold hydrolase [Bacteroidaceae bacterium]|nr:alpha/beta fold hydrolase [Bacteroidaceae bacterium]
MRKFWMTMTMTFLMGTSVMAQEHVRVPGPMGELDVTVAKPELKQGEKCPVVVLMHGFISRKENGLFDEMEKMLLAKKVAVVRFDFDGHGKSEGDFAKMTIASEVEDAKAMIRYAHSLDFAQGVSIAGHSQGGVIASLAAGEMGAEEIDRVVLMAPAAVLREDAIRGNTQGNIYDPLNVPEEGVPLFGGRLTLGAPFIRSAQTLDIYHTAGQYTGEVLLLHGLNDTLVPWTFSEYYTLVYKNAKVEYVKGLDHGFTQDVEGTSRKAVDFLAQPFQRAKAPLLIKAAKPEFWETPTGKYEVLTSDQLLKDHTVFAPKDLTKLNGEKLPVVVMTGPGRDKTGSAFRPFFTEVASHGFLMIATGPLTEEVVNTGILAKGTTQDMLDAIDWAISENNRKDSPYYQKIDTKNICLMGQSAGGLQVLELKDDPRVTCMALFNSGMFRQETNSIAKLNEQKVKTFAKLRKPIAYFLGDTDMARPNGEDDFLYIDKAQVLVAVAKIPGDAHAGTFRQLNGGAFAKAAVAWLSWQLKHDENAAQMFKGDNNGMKRDPIWVSFRKKNID